MLVVLVLAFAVLTFDYSVRRAKRSAGATLGPRVSRASASLALVGVLRRRHAQRRDGVPFAMTVLFFIAAYLTLGVMFWPYMIPYSITVAQRGGAGCVTAIPLLRRRAWSCP